MIVDASVVLAWIFDEPGGAALGDVDEPVISATNWSEVWQKAHNPKARELLQIIRINIVDFDQQQAQAAAELYVAGQPLGLSLADRACLALAKARSEPVLTADRAWEGFPSVDVRLIR